MLQNKIAIDLGTTYTRIYHPKKGVVIHEPTVVALNRDNDKVMAIGAEALQMLGRTPDVIRAYYPMQDGVIADFKVTQHLIRHYVNSALGTIRMRKPEVMISISNGATNTERKAAMDAAKSAGMHSVYAIPSVVAAALGAAVPIANPSGHMVIDIGGGTTEIAVISLSGTVAHNSIRVGGQTIDKAIINYIKQHYNLSIGQATAEEIKQVVGTAMPLEVDETMPIHGRDLVGGLPRSIELKANELVPTIEAILEKMVFAIRSVIEKTPPELVSDIIDHGIILTGGGSQIRNLDRILAKIIGVPVVVAQDPLLATAKGAGMALKNLEDYKRSLFGF